MTNYLINENDRIANDVNPILEAVVEYPDALAGAVGLGAQTVLGLLGESAIDLREEIVGQAQAAGYTRHYAEAEFQVIWDGLLKHLDPRLVSLRAACEIPQGLAQVEYDEEPLAEWERELLGLNDEVVEEPVVERDTKAIDDLLEGLFAAIIGAEAAAEIRAAVEASDADLSDESDYDDYDYDYYDEDDYEEDEDEDEPALSFEDFLNDVFNNSVVQSGARVF